MTNIHIKQLAIICIAALFISNHMNTVVSPLKFPLVQSTATISITDTTTTNATASTIPTNQGTLLDHTDIGFSNVINESEEVKNKRTTNISPSEVLSVKIEKDQSKRGALDWFKKVQYIWERGTDATIVDVDTGKTFKLRRTFGTNHADVEPLTKNDANTIKEIWGGWSWTTRAVVVKVDDYVIAGSLAAMPHAGVDSAPAVQVVNNRSYNYGRGQNLDGVKNNGISGVLDLHFLNSRNHNTNRKKQAHQDMVIKAEKYIQQRGL